MKLRAKQVCLYSYETVHEKAKKDAANLNMPFSKYISALVENVELTPDYKVKLKDKK